MTQLRPTILAVLLACICFFCQALKLFSQASYAEAYPLVCSEHLVDLNLGMLSSTEAYPGKPYSGKVMYYLFEAVAEEVLLYTESASDLVDTELFIFQGQFPDISPLAYADNNGAFLGQGEIQLNDLNLGEFYTIAVAGKNGSLGEVILHIEGDCYSIGTLGELRDNDSRLLCGLTNTLSPGLYKGPDNSPSEPYTSTFTVAGVEFESFQPSVHPPGHLDLCSQGILPEDRGICVPFKTTTDSTRIVISGSESGQAYSFRYSIYTSAFSYDCLLMLTGVSELSSTPHKNLLILPGDIPNNELEPNKNYLLVLELLGGNASEITFDVLLNPNHECSGVGSLSDPVDISLGYSESDVFYKDQILSYKGSDYLNPNSCIGYGTDRSTLFPTKVYRFIGDGTEYSFNISGGAMVSYEYWSIVPGTGGGIFNPPDQELIEVSDFLPVRMVIQKEGEDGCAGVFSAIPVIPKNITFQTEAGQAYRIYLHWNFNGFPYTTIPNETSYTIELFKVSQAAAVYLINNQTPINCGSSVELSNLSEGGDLLESPCHLVNQYPSRTFSFIGTGQSISVQSIFRGNDIPGLGHRLQCFTLNQDTTLNCVYTEAGEDQEILDYSFPTIANQIYLFHVSRTQSAIDSVSHSFEIFNFNCVDCLTQFGPNPYPVQKSDQFVQRTLNDIPSCCSLSWNGSCENYYEQLILDSIAQRSDYFNCGIYEMEAETDPLLADHLLGNSDFKPNFSWKSVEFMGTGENMTIQVVAPVSSGKLDPKTLVFTGTGMGSYTIIDAEQEQSLDGASSLSFNSILDQSYYVLISGFGNSYGDFTLTITDPNECGLCPSVYSGDFPGGPNDPIFNSLIQINPSCCNTWSNSCQSLYEVSYFPGCSTIPLVSCGDTLIGSTVNQQIYTGHQCDGEGFSSGAQWYSFMGDGSTFSIESLPVSSGLEFNTRLHVFIGECPFLDCVASDESSGAAAKGRLQIPTNPGTVYYLAITGVGAQEGDFAISVLNQDYCGSGCLSAFLGQHNHNPQDPIYQSVILENPSCCETWGVECDLQYQLNACSGSFEPNNNLNQLSFQGVLGNSASDKTIQAAIAGPYDEDYFGLSLLQTGNLSINLNSNALLPDLQLAVYQNGVELASSTFAASLEFINLSITEAEIGDISIRVWPADGTDFSLNECYDLSWYWTPDPCSITISAVTSSCDPSTNSFEVDIDIDASNYNGFNWIINGTEFNIAGTSGAYTLQGLHSDGTDKNLHIVLKEDPTCSVFIQNAFTSPEPCGSSTCPMDVNGDSVVNTADLTALLGAFGLNCP